MTTTLVVEYDFSHHNYHTIVTTTTTLVVEYDLSHHHYHTIVTMTTTLVVEYDFSHHKMSVKQSTAYNKIVG
jgi:hypothetical protein